MTNGKKFNSDQQTVPKLLQKSGCQTAVSCNWHLGTTPRGFDHFDVLEGHDPTTTHRC